MILRIFWFCCNLNKFDILIVSDYMDFKCIISFVFFNSLGIIWISKRNIGSGYVVDSEVISVNFEFSDKS